MLNILGKRYYFFLLSAILIIPGLTFLLIDGFNHKLPLSIDFTGGSLLDIRFITNEKPQPADLINVFNSLGISGAQVQTTGGNTFIARTSFLDDVERAKVISAMKEKIGEMEVLRFDSVGPVIGQEVTIGAIYAVIVSSFIVVFYIWFAFRGVPNAFRLGICAISAMLHDIAVVFSLVGIGGHFLGWQIDAMLFTALLTVIGFSMQDTIVVFDRIRENSNLFRRLPFETMVNHSIIQTLQRSINTQLMTVEFMLLALALFGGITLREFAIVLLIGLLCGTYSSIFIAAPILVLWENQEWKYWFRKNNAAV